MSTISFSIPIINNSSLIFTIFSAFVQFERDMIANRTSEGKNMLGTMIQHLKKDVPQNLQKNKLLLK